MTSEPALAEIARTRVQMTELLPADREYPAEAIRSAAAGEGWRASVHELLGGAGPIAYEAGIYVADATPEAGLFMEIWVTGSGPDAGGYKWTRHGARSDGDWNAPLFSCAIPADLAPRHLPRDLELGSDIHAPASLHWTWATDELAEFERAVIAALPFDRTDILRRSRRTSAGAPWVARFPGISPGCEFFYRKDHHLADLIQSRTDIEVQLFDALGADQALLTCRQARAGLARPLPGHSTQIHARVRELAEVSAEIRRISAESRAAGAVPIGKAIPLRQRGLL